MRDQVSDMVEERLDLAFRSGEIADASLVARRVGLSAGPWSPRRSISTARRALDAGGPAAHTCLIHDATAISEVGVSSVRTDRSPCG